MKQTNFPFFLSGGRAGILYVIIKLMLCLLIPLGIINMTGCDMDMEDLSEKDLIIFWGGHETDSKIVLFGER